MTDVAKRLLAIRLMEKLERDSDTGRRLGVTITLTRTGRTEQHP